MQPILELKNLTFSYHSKEGETKVLDNVIVRVEKGDFVGLVGPSGCGKTTILNLLAGIMQPSCGNILLDGRDIRESLDKVALMPQRDQLFEWRNIERNIMLGHEVRHINTKKNREMALSLLKKYGLGDFAGMHPSQLSGGMRQRAALIRTLVTQPEILLLDEPFSALDFQTRLNVCDDVYKIIKQEEKTAVLVSHDISECISLCDKIIVLSARPSRVKDEIDIEIDKSLTPLKRREDKLFPKYFERIWMLLEEKKNDG